MAGVLSITRGRDGAPAIPGLPAADFMASLAGLSGVLMALLRRKETGRGDFLDIAMADCLLMGMANNLGDAMAHRRQPDASSRHRARGYLVPSRFVCDCLFAPCVVAPTLWRERARETASLHESVARGMSSARRHCARARARACARARAQARMH